MARISTYGIDAKPELSDKVVGTDSRAGASLATKNYTLGDVAALLNHTNSLAVADQVIFEFESDISSGRPAESITFAAGGGNNTLFADITAIMVSKLASGGKNISNYFPLFIGKEIILAQTDDINTFGVYRVADIVENATETAFWDVTLESYGANGAINNEKYYIFGEFINPNAGHRDKNFVYIQSPQNPQPQWQVQHNLNKFPSCTVALDSGQQGFADVTFVDENNLTINFAGSESGKAFIN